MALIREAPLPANFKAAEEKSKGVKSVKVVFIDNNSQVFNNVHRVRYSTDYLDFDIETLASDHAGAPVVQVSVTVERYQVRWFSVTEEVAR